MTHYAHLHLKAQEQLTKSDQDRIDWIYKSRWIGYPRAQQILDRLEDLLRHPKKPRMPNMLLIGPSNNGKTSIIRRFVNNHPPDENLEGDHLIAPVIFAQAPPSPTEAGFYTQILSSLFERVPASSTDAKRERVVNVLKRIEARILIIDELHNILAGSSTRQQQFLNMIKYLSNELEIVVVGTGTGDLLRAVSVDAQIQNRFPPEIIPNWKVDKEFRQLLVSFEHILPLKQPSQLHDKLLSQKILAMSEGTIGELSELLNRAASYAIKKGIEHINIDVLNKCGYIAPSDRTQYAARV